MTAERNHGKTARLADALELRVDRENEILDAAEEVFRPEKRKEAQELLADIQYFEHHAHALAESLGMKGAKFGLFEEGGVLRGFSRSEQVPGERTVVACAATEPLGRFLQALG